MEKYKGYLTNKERYPWLALNPDYTLAKTENYLKWGNSTAIIEKEKRNSIKGKKTLTVIRFFYKDQLVKTYELKGSPSTAWVNDCIKDYTDSRELDTQIREEGDCSYSLMCRQFEKLKE